MRTWKIIAGSIMAVSSFVIFIIVGIRAVEVSSGGDERSLQMVHIIMRHGIRTPASTYPNDPHKDNPLYPVGWGQLTNSGKLGLYKIGQYFRERYGKFLGKRYSPDEYYTQSTDVDRSKASMQVVNAGLWPPKGDQVWGPLEWQPIPIHSEPLDQDMLLLVRKPCPKYHTERQKILESEEIKNMFKPYENLFKELTEITGQVTKDFDGVQDIYTTLQAEREFNLTLPDWTKEYYPTKMYIPTIKSFVLNVYNDQMHRLRGGVLLKKIIEDWTEKSTGKETKKAYLYGGHDSTIVNLLSALKVWDEQLPDYAITILLELRKNANTNEFGVEIYLRNDTTKPPYKLTVPGCDQFCPLTKLKELTQNVIPKNWTKECEIDDKSFVVPELHGP